MTLPTKKTLWRNTSLKLTAFIFGYTVWYIFGQSHMSSAWITVPLCFYNIPAQTTIKGPETIAVKIVGKRSALRNLALDMLAIHINAEQLVPGPNNISLTSESIFLPESIKLVHYSPSNPTVEVVQDEAESLDS